MRIGRIRHVIALNLVVQRTEDVTSARGREINWLGIVTISLALLVLSLSVEPVFTEFLRSWSELPGRGTYTTGPDGVRSDSTNRHRRQLVDLNTTNKPVACTAAVNSHVKGRPTPTPTDSDSHRSTAPNCPHPHDRFASSHPIGGSPAQQARS